MAEPSTTTNNNALPSPATPRRRLGCGGTLVLLALILALFGGFLFYRVEIAADRAVSAGAGELFSLAGKVRDAFMGVTNMQPRVTVNEQVIFTQTSPVLEVATVSEQSVVERETTATWLGSTKRLKLRGLYKIKAGYDLRKPFDVRVDAGTSPVKVVASVPKAKILSVEQQKVDILTMENGAWNRVDATDLTNEINELTLDARDKAWRGGIIDKAQKSLADQLKEKLGTGYVLEIVTAAAGEAIPSPTAKP